MSLLCMYCCGCLSEMCTLNAGPDFLSNGSLSGYHGRLSTDERVHTKFIRGYATLTKHQFYTVYF